MTHGLPSGEFQNFITTRDLFDIETVGNHFTWSTHRATVLVAAHLDCALANQTFLDLWAEVELLVLPMVCSDHHPIRLGTSTGDPFAPRPFCFQDMWTKHETFSKLVKDCWVAPIPFCNLVVSLITKLRRLKTRLHDWNRDVFRNVFTNI